MASRTTGAGGGGGAHLGVRLSVLGVVVVGLFATVLLRLWSIQVIGATAARSQALQTVTDTVAIEPPRGSIVMRGGQVLAEDRASNDVLLACPTSDRASCPAEDSAVIARLAPLLGTSVAQIDSAVESNQIAAFAPAPVAVGVPYSVVAYLAEHAGEFPGVTVSRTYQRTYPEGSLAAQVVGYVGSITSSEYAEVDKPRYASYGYTPQDPEYGQSGLESQYELQLHGKPGVSRVEVSNLGQDVGTLSTTPPTPGDTLVLNMSAGLERAVTNALASQVQGLRSGTLPGGPQPAPWAGAVVLDPRNGHVLAMASYPSYNDNLWVPGISQKAYDRLVNQVGEPLENWAIDGTQPPGSTFKIATATAALQDGLITPSTVIVDTGTFTIGNKTLHDAGGEVLGPLTIVPAIAESSDIFFYTMGAWFWQDQAKYGLMPIQHYAALYGLGQPSGIDLPNAAIGQVDSPALRKLLHEEYPSSYPNDTYYAGDNVEMAFGQGETLVTPLEIANAFGTFANGGTRYAPEMAAALVSPNGAIHRIAPKVVDRISYSPANYQAILQGFEGAVQDPLGTAYAQFQGFPFSKWLVAGKTGTATITHTSAPTSWFVAFGGPKGQPPKYVVCVEVKSAGYGDQGSAPAVRKIFDYLYAHGVGPVHLAGAPPVAAG